MTWLHFIFIPRDLLYIKAMIERHVENQDTLFWFLDVHKRYHIPAALPSGRKWRNNQLTIKVEFMTIAEEYKGGTKKFLSFIWNTRMLVIELMSFWNQLGIHLTGCNLWLGAIFDGVQSLTRCNFWPAW